MNTIYELKYLIKYLDNMVHTVDPSTQKTEAGGSWVWSLPALHRQTPYKKKRNWQNN